jgi:hypothetical protein
MLSRLLWIGIAGAALIAGIALQDGNSMFGWFHNSHVSAKTERSIDARVERAIEGSFDKMQVVGSDGREVDVPAETKRALANAVGRLVKAEADMAIARVGDDDEEAMREASARRDQAATRGRPAEGRDQGIRAGRTGRKWRLARTDSARNPGRRSRYGSRDCSQLVSVYLVSFL